MMRRDRMHSIQASGHSKSPRSRRLLTACVAVSLLALAVASAAAPVRELPPFRIDPSLPAEIVVNAEQGLGQCHWLDSSILSLPYVSWAYDAGEAASSWATIEPQEGTFNWEPLDGLIAKAHNMGKHIWLELLTTEGQTPGWARDAGVLVIGSRGGVPVPWNETYQRLLRRAVHAMAARYDDDPTVDAVNVMAGGTYGEMSFPRTDIGVWEQAGYTNDRFIETVKQIIDIYLEEEYVWEDGTRTHGFLKTPIVLQLGSGLYGHTTVVIPPVLEYAISRYGMRVWLKYNGFGSGYDMGWAYQQYNTATRVGYEPGGNSPDFLSKPREYMRTALEHHASYLCLQAPYFNVSDVKWQEAREFVARHLGTHIVSQGIDAPDVTLAGQEYTFTTSWVNRGTVPLMRPDRQGAKDVPASYDILIAFVDVASDLPVFEHSFTPTVATTEWHSAQPVSIETTVRIPGFVPAGRYDLRIALVNPNVSPYDERRCFRLVNADLDDGSGRYTVGQITVLHQETPTATAAPIPTPTPTPTGGEQKPGSWLLRLLQAIWEWLRSLFQ